MVDGVDEALTRWLPDQFCTGIIAQLDFATGVLQWSNCGHPAPLLIRDQRLIVDALTREADPPMGLRSLLSARDRRVHETRLQPGDRVLLYSDGVTEARMADGRLLGLERFADYVIRASATGEIAPETLRRLIDSLLDSEESRLRDDATIVMFEWKPAR
ncbi:PP2C family protein-serine/threonine phosphatase [Streptomyces sp. NPDC051133]|uniref:PP2C family protein-serine/threonine phosphatase n=1 Tax=Streptomyces sp. NPDC051133 TaxID=3155521 RepID=UPI00341A63BA